MFLNVCIECGAKFTKEEIINPCPLCGGTRFLLHVLHGDERYIETKDPVKTHELAKPVKKIRRK
jgi:predicted  nucleic acid-binding Zn-ribbon protein